MNDLLKIKTNSQILDAAVGRQAGRKIAPRSTGSGTFLLVVAPYPLFPGQYWEGIYFFTIN